MAGAEKAIVKKVIARIKELGGYAVKKYAGGYARPGEPDVDGCLEGRALKIEVKVPGRKPTKLQEVTLRKWANAGAVACWVTSVEELDEVLWEAGFVGPLREAGFEV